MQPADGIQVEPEMIDLLGLEVWQEFEVQRFSLSLFISHPPDSSDSLKLS